MIEPGHHPLSPLIEKLGLKTRSEISPKIWDAPIWKSILDSRFKVCYYKKCIAHGTQKPPSPSKGPVILRVGALDNITYGKLQRTVGAVLFAFKSPSLLALEWSLFAATIAGVGAPAVWQSGFHYRLHLQSRQYYLMTLPLDVGAFCIKITISGPT